MTLTYGCVKTDGSCECDPCCCDSDPNCSPERGDDLRYFENTDCCYGPWDTYVKIDGAWVFNHTILCLSDVSIYYSTGVGSKYEEYAVVLTGKPINWDAIEDPETPECWFLIDP